MIMKLKMLLDYLAVKTVLTNVMRVLCIELFAIALCGSVKVCYYTQAVLHNSHPPHCSSGLTLGKVTDLGPRAIHIESAKR